MYTPVQIDLFQVFNKFKGYKSMYDKYTLISIIQKCIYQICSYFDFMESYLYSYRHSTRLIHPSSYCI